MRGGGLEFFSGGFDANGIKHCLQSPDPAIQASAIKQIIANMTVGKDQSSHFADVARLINSANLSVKKMVYLYLMQNAKSQPEKAVMYAGSFVRDATHDSPVIRGIAVRTMASLQVPAMTPFANEVVIKGLHDADPYVRRNAAFGVLKLFQVSPEVLQESTGRLQDLVGLLADPFAAVVAAAVATICELVTLVARPEQLISSLVTNVNTLLNALSECTEWSQIYLLQGVSLFFTEQARHLTSTLADCETIADRVLTFLQSSNPAVVMATINVVTNFLLVFCGNSRSSLTALQQTELEKKYSTKIAPALVSMVTSTKYEIRYVALRNVRIIVQRYKECLVPHITSFFVKFDDPIYIKLEKIDIMLNLATRANAEIILAELVEYATEIDIELVRKAVRCVGVLCVKVPTVAPQCVERLIKLIESRVSYIVQEAAVVVQTILRQYPSTYEAIIVTLCKSLDVLDDPESKAAVVWVLGEYADRIDNVVDLINIFFDGFPDEPLVVQLAILTATVKIFFVSAINASVRQATLERGLGLATQSPHVDLRDRACFYWRLILADAAAASKVINSERDRIVESGLFDRGLLNELLKDTGRLTSVLHHSLSVAFGDGRRAAVTYDESDEETDADATARNRAARGETAALNGNPALQIEFTAPVEGLTNFITSPQATRMLDFVSVLDGATAGAGLNVAMAWEASTPLPRLHTKFSLASSSNLPSARVVMMQLNLNCWGLGFAEEFSPIEIRTERPGEVALAACTGNQQRATEEIQVAVKAEPMGVLFFIAPPIPPSLMIAPAPHIEATDYAQQFTKLDVAWGMPPTRVVVTSEDIISQRNLRLLGITLVHRRDEAPLIGLHLHCQCVNGSTMFAEVTLDSYKVALANIKTADATLADFFGNYLLDVLRA